MIEIERPIEARPEVKIPLIGPSRLAAAFQALVRKCREHREVSRWLWRHPPSVGRETGARC